MSKELQSLDTLAVHAGRNTDPTTGSILPPIYQTATFVLDEIGKDKGFDYSRSSNPTRAALEENLAAIEGGKYGVSFASGMSAVDAVLRLLSSGDHVISVNDVYGGVSRLFDRILSKSGIRVTYVDASDPNNFLAEVTPSTKMIWIETPTNPLLQITDLESVGRIAKEHNLLLAVDSTFATPCILRPLDFGADIVVHSTTKYLSGHNQVIGGVCITSNEELFKELKFVQKSVGAVSSPFDCWLTLSGLKTLPLRMERHSQSGQVVAEFLEASPKVSRVLYPGLTSHPQHAIAREQQKGFGGMISFELKGGYEAGIRLMNSVSLCSLAESLGAVETMITHPASMTHVDVPREQRIARGLSDGLVRLSVGIEGVEDILADLDHALSSVD